MTIPRVALQYPLLYREVFEPLTDFEVWSNPGDSLGRLFPNKELWYDCSDGVVVQDHFADGVILPTYDEPGRNLLNIARENIPGKLNVGIWRGERSHLKLLTDACDVVALPFYEYGRMNYVPEGMSHLFHLYEFCSLDELRRYPVRSIHTSVPITAALMGIDLRGRERRPKNLPPFTYDIRLTDSQLELAVINAKAIKEAVYSHYADTTSQEETGAPHGTTLP